MLSFRWIWKLRLLSRNVSVRAALYGFAGLVAALIGVVFAPYVPDGLAELLGGEAVRQVLTVLASSMLAVVTFSMSTLISAYAIVAGSAPPRATSLVIEDAHAQSALSTFLGSFIFSILSLVALTTGYYGPKGRVILFLNTLLILVSVIWTIVRWIGQLSGFSRLSVIIAKVEAEAEKSIENCAGRFEWSVGGFPTDPVSDGGRVTADATGFVQTFDLKTLACIAETVGANFYVSCLPGAFVQSDAELVRSDRAVDEETAKKIRESFVIGEKRTFIDDPQFGFIALSEIGSRALSPAINDPGTAIHVLGCLVRLLHRARTVGPSASEPSTRLRVRRITATELFDDAFRAIGRDGAALLEVGVFLQKALRGLAERTEFREAAEVLAANLRQRSRHAMTDPEDKKRIDAAFGSRPAPAGKTERAARENPGRPVH
ncbi:MAG: DUF2254 domain-containing protein [Bdellovibrionales bacterium]|nr:DUF2254 domain-containing protein [Bdellovibrionales bacterium]